MQRLSFNLKLASEAVLANPLRAVLTGLGIMFGVGAVIAMLAIGTGAKESILEQMKLIGTNHIVVEAVKPADRSSASEGQDQDQEIKWSPGLSLNDLRAINESLPTVKSISPEIVRSLPIIYGNKLDRGQVVGISQDFFTVNNIQLGSGRYFHFTEVNKGRPICILGANVVKKFFPEGNPIGKYIKCGQVWLSVIGVLKNREGASSQTLGIKDRNNDIYVPSQTALLYFGNRARITAEDIDDERDDDEDNEAASAPQNPHQVDRFVVEIKDASMLEASADVISRMLFRRHRSVQDFQITIPRLLLEQQQRTQDTFNIVLASIAAISLLVGGIGIMNIMLASVLERTKEIGVRRSLGATRTDITQQFLCEAALISLIGGALGVAVGVTSANVIASYADIQTIVSTWSVALSFGVAASVGLVFGLLPAQRAAELDPIKALRTD